LLPAIQQQIVRNTKQIVSNKEKPKKRREVCSGRKDRALPEHAVGRQALK
jgi:hypothetical protein